MEVFKEISTLREHLKTQRTEGKKIGLVPTMGALHEGHLTLVRSSIKENDITVCSVYVNPTQFNNQADLKNYPRELQKDIDLLKKEGCNVVFTPDDGVMYPDKASINISFGKLEEVMEGSFRPGHFNGVATIVSKLFNIVDPDKAYFGQKDLQQFLIIKQLVKGLSFPVELRCVDVVRESNGLAMSSRNLRLSQEDKKKSVILHQSLVNAKKSLSEGGAVQHVKSEATSFLDVDGVDLEYFEIVDGDTLREISNISEQKNVAICVAAFIGGVRLIDNIVFTLN